MLIIIYKIFHSNSLLIVLRDHVIVDNSKNAANLPTQLYFKLLHLFSFLFRSTPIFPFNLLVLLHLRWVHTLIWIFSLFRMHGNATYVVVNLEGDLVSICKRKYCSLYGWSFYSFIPVLISNHRSVTLFPVSKIYGRNYRLEFCCFPNFLYHFLKAENSEKMT